MLSRIELQRISQRAARLQGMQADFQTFSEVAILPVAELAGGDLMLLLEEVRALRLAITLAQARVERFEGAGEPTEMW